MQSPPCPVRVWVRRDEGEAQPYSLRFECGSGRALLRVIRGGVLIDVPATSRSVESALSAEQLRSAVLVHVGPKAHRSAFSFDRLDEGELEDLPTAWSELRCAHEEARWSCELRRIAPTLRPSPAVDAPPPIALPAPTALSPASAELAGAVARLQAELEAEQARCRALIDRLNELDAERTLTGR